MTHSSIFDSSASSRLQLESAIRSSQRARQLTEQDADLVLNYCTWLRKKQFLKECNEIKAKAGLPPSTPPLFLQEAAASHLYHLIARELAAGLGYTLLGIGEPNAVEAAIRTRKASTGTAAPAGSMKRGSLKVGSIQKFVSSGGRRIRGVASSSRPDRMGDIVEPKGGIWSLPVPLLWMHNHREPVGWVRAIDVGTSELRIEAEFATGVGRADEIWAMVDRGLVDSFSIGFRSLQSEPLANGGLRFTKWELLEVSCVSVPANADAKIGKRADTSIKLQPGRRAGAVKLQPSSQDGAVKLHQHGVRLITPGVKLGGR